MARFDIPDDDRTLWDPYDNREDSGLIDDDYSDYAYEAARDERLFEEVVV